MDSAIKKFIEDENDKKLKTNDEESYKTDVMWIMVLILIFYHIAGIYGLYLVFTSASIATTLFAIFLYEFTMLGTTAGAHRLWAHRTYKAKWPLQLLLMIMFSTSYQLSVLTWSRNHRVHHKFTDTSADPYSSKRGFLISHIGWMFLKNHPNVAKKSKEIDMSDLHNNPLVKFQHENKTAMLVLCCYIIPTTIPMLFWNETLDNSFYISVALRWTLTTHIVGLVNSASHMLDNKPCYNNAVLHKHHYVFPWDYTASEYGNYWTNNTTRFINLFAWLGWAYDLKTVRKADLIEKRILRTGGDSQHVWGWGDKDMTKEDCFATTILSPKNATKLVK